MKLDATQAAAAKLSHLIEPGRTVYSTDGRAYRVLSKIASGGSLSFRLANLQGQPVTPVTFFPIDGTRMRFASFLKFAYNKDITNIVNEMIQQAGLPIDPKMDWSAYLTKTYAANLRSVTTDPDIQDEVIYRTVIYLLFERKNKNGKKVLENFAEKLKNFDVKTQKKPLAEQVSDYLKGTFLYYAKDHAKQDAIALMRPEELSMEQPGEEGETYNILDTEEHATLPGVGQGEADRDIDQFIEQFQEWVKTKETPKSAPNYAALLKIYWEQAQQSERGDVKISDLTQEWIRRTGLSFDSLKQYRDKIGGLIRDFVYENKAQLGNSYKLVDLLQHMFPPPPKAKARPAKASSDQSKQAMNAPDLSIETLNRMYRIQLEGLAQGDCEGDGTETCDCETCEAREELERLTGKQATKKPKCPHCGSSDYGLMPTDFETAKCNGCGKNWEHGIVKGINDPKTAAQLCKNCGIYYGGYTCLNCGRAGNKLEEAVSRFSKELKKFPKGPTGMTPDDVKATPEWQEAKRNYNQAFEKLREFNSQKQGAENLGQCSCEWSECPLGHQAGGCPNPAVHMLEIYGFKTRYCQPCTDETIEYIRLEHGTGDPDDTVKILSSEDDDPPAPDSPTKCGTCGKECGSKVCDECRARYTKSSALDPSDESYDKKCAVCGEKNFDRISGRLVCQTCHPEKHVKESSKYGDKIKKKMEARRGESIETTLKKADDEEKTTLQKLPNDGGFTPVAGIEKEGMLGHDFVDADQQTIRPDITPGDTGRVPHGRTQGSGSGMSRCNCGITPWDSGIHKEWCYVSQHPREENDLTAGSKEAAESTGCGCVHCGTPHSACIGFKHKVGPCDCREKWDSRQKLDDQHNPAKRDWQSGEWFNRNRVKESADALRFVVMPGPYPLEVHKENCRDMNMPKYRSAPKDWVLTGNSVDEVVNEEASELNSQFDHPYETKELFRIMPCCRKKVATSLQVLECCGSVTGHHKPDCKVYNENFNKTLTQLYPEKFKTDEKIVSATKTAGKWKVLLRDSKGQQREQQVSGVDYSSASRAVRKYMKEGENVVSMTIASKKKTAAPASAAPAKAAPVPVPTPMPAAPGGVVGQQPGVPIALPSQQEDRMRKTVPPELPGKKWHMSSKTASILEDAFQYFMESKKDGGLADVFNETYTRTGKGEDKYMAVSKLMMDFEYAFQREEDGSLSDIDDYREDAENALREIVGDDPNYSERTDKTADSEGLKNLMNTPCMLNEESGERLKSEQNTPGMEAEVATLAQTHPETEIHENCNPYFEHDQWWVVCGPCGAIWSVVDVGNLAESGLDLEAVEMGDDSCQDNFHESSTIQVPPSLATQAQKVTSSKEVDCAGCGKVFDPTDVEEQGHESEGKWYCGDCSKEASGSKTAWTDEGEEEETIEDRLEYLRGELRAERISQGELMELQGLVDYIDPGDVELLEAAGVEEVIPQPDIPIETPTFDEADKTRLKGLGVIGKKKKAFEPDANSGIRGSNDGTYIYQAELWCPTCAKEIAADIQQNYPQQVPADPTDERSYDSDNYPKGPEFEGESDSPDHCAGCKIFLENPLTTDGYEYMKSMVDEALAKGRGEEPHIKEWMDFYGYHGPEVEETEEHEASDASDKINAMPQRGRPKSPSQLGLQEKSELDLRNEGIPLRSSEDKEAAMDNKKAAIAQPTSGEDEGFNVKVVYNKYGITLEPTANLLSDVQGIGEMINKPNIFELMEDFFTNGWEMVNPEDIGALTSGELMSDQDGNVYWHERYQIEDMVEELMNGNKVNLQYGGNLFEMDEGSEIAPPAEPDPNQMDLPLQSSAEDTDYKDWQYEVANGDTKLNFEDWKMHKEEADKFSPTSSEDTDHKDWQYEVANGDTKLNFEQWKEHKREADSFGPNKKEATGEMSQGELDATGREEWPMHYNIADALGAEVKPFDQYQGPYVRVPEGRLWVTTPEGAGDGAELIVWNEHNRKSSEPFMWDDENAAVDAALSVMDNPPANTLPWGAEREEQLKNGPDTSDVEDTVPAEHPKDWTPTYDEGDKARLKGLGVKGSKKRAAPGDGGLQRDVQNQYENHPVVQMLWDSLKRDPQHKDRVQTAWGTKTKQGLVLSIARAMKESPASGE
jgi:hypothetical protein